jgi:hypothetical protein
MYRSFILIWLVCAAPASMRAADLAQARRPLPKVPKEAGASFKYCLLVFGPEGRTHIWLAWDGTTLYADEKGHGDLTRPDARITGKKWNPKDPDEDSELIFQLGEINNGDRRHKDICVVVSSLKRFQTIKGAKEILAHDAKARAFSVSAAVEVPGFRGQRSDGRLTQAAHMSDDNGILQFADRPENAPVVHFGGPWTIAVNIKPTLRINREAELYLALATAGLGPGTCVLTAYDKLVPEGLRPRAEITFPAAMTGGALVKASYELKGRC